MADAETVARGGWRAFEPLRERTYRNIWSASLLSNFGQLILGVGAAWEMTRLTAGSPKGPEMVALVQSALMLPMMLIAVPSGAIADMLDRRKVALTGLGFASLCGALLTALAFAGLTTPWMILAFCSLIGAGVALYGPAWQASVSEQVSAEHLPAAIALTSISYNIARSVGPAVGGLIVVAAGAMAAFAVNAIFYLPLLTAFFFWQRKHVPPRLPPERIDRAIISGARYSIHSTSIKTVMIRAFTFSMAGSSVAALTPLLAKDQLKGDASTYGLLLGAYGVGAVAGALFTSDIRERFKGETSVRICALATGLMVLLIGLSHNLLLTASAMAVAGAAWMLLFSLLNVGVQLSSPRWVTARALSWYQASLTGGVAIGAWLWGRAAAQWGVSDAFLVSGAAVALLPLLGLLLPMPAVSLAAAQMVDLGNEPEVALGLTARSGPVVVEVDYRVDPDHAREFYDAVRRLQRVRLRNGGFNWSIARDIADPSLWTERYQCPTWGDYLRQRARLTQADMELQAKAQAFQIEGQERRVRRRLERPFGSVRWRADTPDPLGESINIITP
jgi:MFS family permease